MPDPSVHRTIRIGDHGADVKRLQQGLNRTVDAYEFDWRRVEADGEWGHLSVRVARLAAFAMGLSRKTIGQINGVGDQKPHVTERAQKFLRHDRRRTPAMRARSLRRRPILRKLREEHRKAIEAAKSQDGIVMFDGKPCAKWIAAELQKARGKGWGGSLVSGFRTPEHSEALCFAICGAPSCPGRCAGKASNHACPSSFKCAEGEGAADCSDFVKLLAILRSMNSPLHGGMLPSDPVHFSASGF